MNMFEVCIMKFLYCFFILASFVLVSEGKIFERCELAEDLLNKYNFKREQIADWVCLAFAESTYNTSAIGYEPNWRGIFQINDLYWCAPPGPHNECHLDCQSLHDDDIADDVKCAKLIFERQGFPAWGGWLDKCRGRDLSSFVEGCNI